MSERVAEIALNHADDVFFLRHVGRVAASAAACDEADQVRLATALSELGRDVLANGGGALAVFSIRDDGALAVDIERFPSSIATNGHSASGLSAARRLIEDIHVSVGSSASTVTVALRGDTRGRVRASAENVRTQIARATPLRPLDELRQQNRDLIAAFDNLKLRQEEVERANGELEETNLGVMAMYTQLTGELEETNRGVVALYAELDEKTAQLNEASESKSRFLASVSHELRTPVNSIIGLTSLLLDAENENLQDDQRRQLQLTSKSASELLALVNELLDLAKAESGRLEPEVEKFDLAEVLADLRGSLRPLVRPGVAFKLDVSRLPQLESDRTLLTQALRNLVSNALKFTAQGSVTLSAEALETPDVRIEIADTGIGIARENQTRIFEEFFQVRGPLQVARAGTGLGLPYARRVIEVLGGTMHLESELGKGSVFRVVLPLEWQPLLRARKSPGALPNRTVRFGTVLIIDDDDAFRSTLRGLLQGIAERLVEAPGGIDGLRLMRELRPDLTFLDLRMPDMDGSEVLERVREDPVLQDTPVVVVTSAEVTNGAQQLASKPVLALLSKSNLSRQVLAELLSQTADSRVSASL